MDELISLEKERNLLIRRLWVTLKEISYIENLDMSDEDLNLWTLITNHSACQKMLA